MAASLKAEKESFVSGHSGTTVLEIAAVLVGVVAGYSLRNVLLVCSPRLAQTARRHTLLAYLLDFSVLVLPGVLLFTVLADYALPYAFCSLSLTAALAAYSFWRAPGGIPTDIGTVPYTLRTLPFITAMRTYTNLFTAIAILAVDFQVFPRRFAKTETYGTGLMDIGVGLFMVAHGLTSPEARGHWSHGGYVQSVVGTVRRVLPLLLLGLVRLASVKATGYQEHVTEYGVHWNFFFTIAFVRVLCSAISPLLSLLPHLPYLSSSLLLVSLHQLFLSGVGGTQYVLLGPSGDGSRMGLLSANREGVVSCVGYLAVYLASMELGRWFFQTRKMVRDFYPVCVFLGVGVVWLWTLTSVCEVYVQRISRRLTNLTFILWLVFLFLLIFLVTDLLLLVLSRPLPRSSSSSLPSPLYTQHKSHSPSSLPPPPVCVVSAIDYNQLLFFLSANLLTGLVNFSLDTLHTPHTPALGVLVMYMCVLIALSIILHRHHIKFKL